MSGERDPPERNVGTGFSRTGSQRRRHFTPVNLLDPNTVEYGRM